MTDTFAYNAFGEQTERTGTTPIPFRYHGEQGYYWDEEIGDYHVQRRDLDPSQGRWLSADPIGLLNQFVNLYSYVANRPTFFVDPTGEFAVENSTCAPDDSREGKWKGTCADKFPPSMFFDQATSKVGAGCTPEKLAAATNECIVSSEGKFDKFVKCLDKKCGGGKPSKEILEAMLKWTASVSCCEASKAKTNPDPCECGKKGPDQKPPKKCKDPLEDGKAKFPSSVTCQECCDFHACVAGLKTLIDLAKSGGVTTPIIGGKAAWGAKSHTECVVECT